MFFISDKSKTLFVEVRHYWQTPSTMRWEVTGNALRSSYEMA